MLLVYDYKCKYHKSINKRACLSKYYPCQDRMLIICYLLQCNSDYCYEDFAAARYWFPSKLKKLKSFEHKRKQNSGFVKDKYIKDIPTLNLRDLNTTLRDNRMFTDIKSLVAYGTPFRPEVRIYFYDGRQRFYYERSRFS